jgi:hypothetical protein
MSESSCDLYKPNLFKILCDAEFQFLIDEYGFRKRKLFGNSWGQTVQYSNKTTRVWVSFGKREGLLDVWVAPEVRGRDPWGYAFDPNKIEVSELINQRAPGFQLFTPGPVIDTWRPLNDREIEEIVRNSARALKEFGDDLLRGDFRIMPAIHAVRAKRREEWQRGHNSSW